MKILLIHSYVTSDSPHTVLTEPLGLACLAAYLSQHDVRILDLYASGFQEVKKVDSLFRRGLSDKEKIISIVADSNPDIIGITCNFTAYASDALEVAKIAKESRRDCLVVLGGAHASMEAENILREHDYVDVIVRGEGEVTFSELAGSVDEGVDFYNIDGLTYRDENGAVRSNPKRPLLADIDSLPVPDRSQLPMDVYRQTNSASMVFAKREPIATIVTSRGCPFDCVFCSTKVVWERKFRPRSAEKVVEEIEMLVDAYRVREIAIMDDQFIIDRARVHKICDLLIDRRLDVTLTVPSGTSIWLADEALLRKMRKAGFYRLCFPIETGNQNSLKFIRKPIDLAKAKETIRLANRIGIWTQGNFIIGFPYETREEIQSTIDYAFRSGLDYALFFIAKPYAGSEMFDIFKKEGLLTEIARGSNIETANYDTKTMRASELQSIRDRASNKYLVVKALYYLNPINFYNYLLPKISSKEDLVYAAKILFGIVRKVFTN